MRGHIDWKEEGNKWGLYCRWDGLEVGGRVGNGALDEGWSVMKCARVWVGRQRLLFLSFSGRIITLHPDSLTFETSSSKENIDGGSRAALVGSGVGSESLRIAT